MNARIVPLFAWLGWLPACDSATSNAAPAEPAPAPRTPPAKLTAPRVEPPRPTPKAEASSTLCTTICDKTDALECGARSDCEAACAIMQTETVCRGELDGFARCLAAEPVAHWTCGEARVPEIRDGYCDAEQSAYFKCLEGRLSSR